MKKNIKKFLIAGVVTATMITSSQLTTTRTAEAGWLGDILGTVINSTSGNASHGKAVQRNNANQTDRILHEAAKNNDYDLAVSALSRGARVNSMYNDLFPLSYALSYASNNNDYRMADLLIEHGADLEGWYDSSRSHFYAFSNSCSNDAVIYLLDKGLNVNLTDENGYTLLMIRIVSTCVSGPRTRSEYIQELVNRGANVNARVKQHIKFVIPDYYYDYQKGETALFGAVAMRDIDTAKVLLYAGADKNIRNADGKTALDMALDRGDTDMIKLLMDWPNIE